MFRKLRGFWIINLLFVYVMKLIIIQTQWQLLKSLFMMSKTKSKENGEHGQNMPKKEKLLSQKKENGLLSS